MSAFTLRPYQVATIDAINADIAAGHTDLLAVLATGAGKTQIFLQWLIGRLERGGRGLILVHRQELVSQPLERLEQYWPDWPLRTGIVMAERNECDRPLTIATVQTLQSTARRDQLLLSGPVDYVVTDECHHSTATSYQELVARLRAANPKLIHLGVTATPQRGDGDGLAKVFQKVSATYGIKELIETGYLVPMRCLGISLGISSKGIRTQGGDWAPRDLADAISKGGANELVVQTHQQYATDRKAIAFLPTVASAYSLADAFNAAGIPAAAADGTTDKETRRRLLADFREGKYQLLANCGLWTEGLDLPEISCIHQVRPTQSDGLYMQCLDMATEILTERGWCCHSKIDRTDRVAGFDVQTGTIRWMPILSTVHRSLHKDEQMYEISSPSLDIRVTGGHRMLMRHRRSPDATWRFMTAEELYHKQSEYQLPVAGLQQAPGVNLTDDELRFIGWYLTDGTLNRANGQISICQSEHQPHHEAIRTCLEGCGFKYSVHSHSGGTEYSETSPRLYYLISKGQPRGTDKHLSGWERLEPYIDKDLSPLLDDVTSEQLAVLLEAIHLGDGAKQLGQSWQRQSYHIATANKVFAERLQSLCVRRGYRCNVAPITHNINPAYQLHIKRRMLRYVGGSNQTDREHLQRSSIAVAEQVWCVENELSTLVIRRNGKVAIVGNCIGRGLRLSPGKDDCVILDYLFKETRNIKMAGDLLGVPQAMRPKDKPDAEPGEVITQFTFDMRGLRTDGTPLEIIARELDYLETSPFSWDRRGGWLVLGLGQASDGAERMLCISPARDDGRQTLYGLHRIAKAYDWQTYTLLQSDDFAALSDVAGRYADKWGNAALVAKARAWQALPPSDPQRRWLVRLAGGRKAVEQLAGKKLELLSRGDVSQLINFYQVKTTLQREGAWLA